VDPALDEQPPRPGEEPADDGIRDEPDHVAPPARPEPQDEGPARNGHHQGRGDRGEEDVLRAPGGVHDGTGRDDRDQHRPDPLQGADDASGAGSPGHQHQRERGRPEVETDAVVQEVELEIAAEDERGEGDREDDLDGSDRDPGDDRRQPNGPLPGNGSLGHLHARTLAGAPEPR
jgi:hypothetical protein